jgi:hypothetical protein
LRGPRACAVVPSLARGDGDVLHEAEETSSLDSLDPAWAWSIFAPTEERPWSDSLAGHLLRRAGFGPKWSRLQVALTAGPQQTVAALLAGGESTEGFYQQSEQLLEPLLATGDLGSLPAWWLHTMLHSPHPLLEKVTLFWHGHFATSAAKVTSAPLMARQNALLRRHALGSFRTLLVESAKDPAMLLWLDSATNHKTRPNENYAREVMELFCLGLGQYSEPDVKEAARAFTGWEVRREQFYFNAAQHDRGLKTVLGRQGNFEGDALIGILLDRPAAARFIVRKLFRFFVSDVAQPSDALLAPLVEEFASGYDIRRLLQTILASNLFFSPHAMGQKIKSPVELAIGLLHALESETNMVALSKSLRDLGQGLFFPPNVKGWDGGADWINSASLLGRANLVAALVAGPERQAAIHELVERNSNGDIENQIRWLLKLLVATDVPQAAIDELNRIAMAKPSNRWSNVVQAIAALPEFQLV